MNIEEWNDFLVTEYSHKCISEVLEAILGQVDERIADIHMEGIVLPQVVDYACGMINQCLEMNDYYCDDVNIEEDFHYADAEPRPPRIDPWAKAPFEYIQNDPEYKELTSFQGSATMLSGKHSKLGHFGSHTFFSRSILTKHNNTSMAKSINSLSNPLKETYLKAPKSNKPLLQPGDKAICVPKPYRLPSMEILK